jgi:hypothetical protein
MALRTGKKQGTYQGVACPRCEAALPAALSGARTQACGRCGKTFEIVRFDPVEPRLVVAEVAAAGPEAGAPCARHARNQAMASCQRCGQFMCGLCRIDADGRSCCPPCFERLSSEGALASTVTKFRNFAGIASLCMVAGLLFMIAGAPLGGLGAYFCIKGIGDKRSRGETDGVAGLYVRLVVCIFVALGGVLVLLAIFGAMSGMFR